jgi:hypothetical protein
VTPMTMIVISALALLGALALWRLRVAHRRLLRILAAELAEQRGAGS